MQELLSRLSNDAVILAADPNLQLYAEICAGISVVLFATAFVIYARKNWFANQIQSEQSIEPATTSRAQNEQESKKMHYA
ncbi:hypothetical protein Pse7367_3319 [Thalassoporum mexicanum PCC 7367]|uniref:hypothetical protein n=1 Tax=Thalassoporum mexicanum TaxID=3457544 RepID=UPI00029FA8C2|nr:hypothetical protein [Pseudanabaena sp. PCC 7367]AFY71559.1 hypothetical protein Pse7367_3319 [Pseudanabaena sp. PCC 7367]